MKQPANSESLAWTGGQTGHISSRDEIEMEGDLCMYVFGQDQYGASSTDNGDQERHLKRRWEQQGMALPLSKTPAMLESGRVSFCLPASRPSIRSILDQ